MSTQYFRFAARAGPTPQRSSLLESLLARADACFAVGDWRGDAFRALGAAPAAMPAVAPVALLHRAGVVPEAWVGLAAPVKYVAEMSNVRLAADGILSLEAADARALAVDFNRIWDDADMRLVDAAGELFCVFASPLEVSLCDPERALGRYIENYLPTGRDAPRLKKLMSEIEMWLFEHPVNRGRAARGQPQVSGLWLWGAGATLSSLPEVSAVARGTDVFFAAFANPAAPSPHAPRDSAAAAPGPGHGPDPRDRRARQAGGVIVVDEHPGTEDWRRVEAEWLRPVLSDLRSGRIARLELSAGDRGFALTARWRRRFWRRTKPWWEYFE